MQESERNLFESWFDSWCYNLRLGPGRSTDDSPHSSECKLRVLKLMHQSILQVVRTNAADAHVVLTEDELVSNNKCAVVVCSQQPVGVVEPDSASTFVHVVNCHGDRKELATLMHSFLHVGDVADDGVAQHGIELTMGYRMLSPVENLPPIRIRINGRLSTEVSLRSGVPNVANLG